MMNKDLHLGLISMSLKSTLATGGVVHRSAQARHMCTHAVRTYAVWGAVACDESL